jgi:hypothetical protein
VQGDGRSARAVLSLPRLRTLMMQPARISRVGSARATTRPHRRRTREFSPLAYAPRAVRFYLALLAALLALAPTHGTSAERLAAAMRTPDRPSLIRREASCRYQRRGALLRPLRRKQQMGAVWAEADVTCIGPCLVGRGSRAGQLVVRSPKLMPYPALAPARRHRHTPELE